MDELDGYLVGLILMLVLVALITGWLTLAWAAAMLCVLGATRQL